MAIGSRILNIGEDVEHPRQYRSCALKIDHRHGDRAYRMAASQEGRSIERINNGE